MTDLHVKEKLIYVLVILTVLVTIVSCKKTIVTPKGDVGGVILYDGTTIPVDGVSIDIDGLKALSMQDGSYMITGVPAGNHTLTADKTGFNTFTKQISVSEGPNMLNIQMVSDVSRLPYRES
jgi:hypothetical protein